MVAVNVPSQRATAAFCGEQFDCLRLTIQSQLTLPDFPGGINGNLTELKDLGNDHVNQPLRKAQLSLS
jgi:hypothetical protein